MAAKVAGKRKSAGAALYKSKQNLPDVTLMLLGKTGAGKSSLGNAILNLSGKGEFQVTFGFCATPVYSAVAKQACVHDRLVQVVDTPGVMDTNDGNGGGDDKVLQGIAEGIACCYDGVDAFLLVIKFGIRLSPEEFESVNKLESLFGPQFWQHVILVFTHGDIIENDLNRFEQELSKAMEQIPWLMNVTSKLSHPPILFDASKEPRSKEPTVAAGQVMRLMGAVDLLFSGNKKKFTNELFTAAKLELATRKNAELEKKLQKTIMELSLLQARVSLPDCRKEDKEKVQILEQKTSDYEARRDTSKRRAAEKAMDAGKKKCSLL